MKHYKKWMMILTNILNMLDNELLTVHLTFGTSALSSHKTFVTKVFRVIIENLCNFAYKLRWRQTFKLKYFLNISKELLNCCKCFYPSLFLCAFWQVYTSPPAFSLARVMAEFRARSHMILSNIEDHDKVLHCHLSDQSDEEEENADSKNKTSFK